MSSAPLVRFVSRERAGRALEHRLARLVFGRPISEDRVARAGGIDTVYHFLPGELFCVARWHRRPRGRQHWALAVVECPRGAGDGHALPDTHPAVVVHAVVEQPYAAGQGGSVDRMLDLARRARARGIEPSRLPAHFWREAACRIVLGQAPPTLPKADPAASEEPACDA